MRQPQVFLKGQFFDVFFAKSCLFSFSKKKIDTDSSGSDKIILDFPYGGKVLMKNKFIRNGSCLMLAGILAMSMTACGKPSAKKLSNVATKKLEAEEVPIEDLEDMKSDDIQDALEDGILINTSGEEIEDVFEDQVKDLDFEELGDQLDIDMDDWEIEDFKNITLYAMADGTDKMTQGKMDEMVCVNATVIEFEDSKKANELYSELMDKFEDLADDEFDIDLEELNKDEYQNKGNKGHIVLNLSSDVLVDAAVSMLEEQYGDKLDKDMKKEIEKSLGDINVVFALYYDNGVMTVIIGFGSDSFDDISTLAKALGIKDPLTVENSDEMIEGITSLFTGGVTQYISKAQEAAQMIEQHNADTQAVVDEIEEVVEG